MTFEVKVQQVKVNLHHLSNDSCRIQAVCRDIMLMNILWHDQWHDVRHPVAGTIVLSTPLFFTGVTALAFVLNFIINSFDVGTLIFVDSRIAYYRIKKHVNFLPRF
jgi:hypothetical protein